MADPTLPFADFLDPRRSLFRRMGQEGQNQPGALPMPVAGAPMPQQPGGPGGMPMPPMQGASGPAPGGPPPGQMGRFGRQFSPQDRQFQQQALIEMLRKRDAQMSGAQPTGQ